MRQRQTNLFLICPLPLHLLHPLVKWNTSIWGHWAEDPVDPRTQRVMLSTPGINSGFYLEHLKRPVVRRDRRRAEYATRCWSYGRRFCHRAMMVLVCWELRVCPVSFLSPTQVLCQACPLCPSLGCCAHPQPGKYRNI